MSGFGQDAPRGAGGAEGIRDEGAVTSSGGPDGPGTPAGAQAWDARSAQWAAGAGESAPPAPAPAAPAAMGAPREPVPPMSPAAEPLAADPRPRGSRSAGPRRGAADPVKVLLHRHRELCERAVDPLEIAAGLEAHGVTDRTAARFRHRDVFSLAEELYARVPRDGAPAPQARPASAPRPRPGRLPLTLLPGALGAAVVTGLHLTHGRPRQLVVLGGLLAVALAVRAALRGGPLAPRHGTVPWRTASGTRAATLWLLGYAALGDGLVRAVVAGGPDALPDGTPDGPWAVTAAPALALLLACAPAAWCAHLLTAGARRGLAGSRGLRDFTAAARPLLLGTVALFLAALTALLALCGTVLHENAAFPQGLTLGALLLLARLLAVHRHRHAPAVALGAAAAAEAVGPALLLAGRLPGCTLLAAPVQALIDAWSPAALPTLACGAAALVLLVHSLRTLTRASAHAPPGTSE